MIIAVSAFKQESCAFTRVSRYNSRMTILSVFEIQISAEALADARELLDATLADTRTRPGCLSVDVTVDVDDPTRFILLERWASVEDDDAYRAWRATPDGAPAIGSIVVAPPVLTRSVVI